MSKTYLIVGGTAGIGLEITSRLSAANHRVYALSRGQHPAPDLPGVSHHPCDVTADVPDFPAVDEALDGLVYLPGSITLKPLHLLKEQHFQSDLQVNLFGAVKTMRQYLANLKDARTASVVFFSTVAVQTGMPYHASIASAKGAVEGLTRALAAELAPTIRVNAVAPSLTDTPLAANLLNHPKKREAAVERHPLKSIGSPRDVAGTVCFLLSEDANWITGRVLRVDGGMSSVRVL